MAYQKHPKDNTCVFEGCSNIRRHKGKGHLHPLCNRHHRLKYPPKKYQLNSTDRFKSRIRKTESFKKCYFCKWDKDTLDLHRIIPGNQGGKYRLDNVLALCPNCHRLIHSGKLTFTPL